MSEQTIAHYRVTAKLGAGGMGEVYRATDTKLGREVALKLLPPETARDATARARLIGEARKASALNHPHICHIYEVNEADGVVYFAMELAEGEPLSKRIPPEGLPAETVIRFGEQIASALAHAHERGILHRDLKSSNVIITPEGVAKVLDFGLALRVAGDSLAGMTLSEKSAEQASGLAGTLAYLAPEVLNGHAASERSDIWALGVLLHEMAGGTLPFQGRTGYALTSAILREPPEPLTKAPAALRAVIQRCLSKEPGQRYQKAAEVRAALEAIASTESAAPRPAPRSGARWIWLALGGIALLATVLAVVKPWRSAARPPVSAAGQPSPNAEPKGSSAMAAIERPSANPEANEDLQRALLFLRVQLNVSSGRQLLERALELDPKFADARAYYAMTYLISIEVGFSNDRTGVYRAEEEARRALQDAPDLARGHCVLGAVYYFQGRNDLSSIESQRCKAGNPEEITAGTWRAASARLRGRTDEAIRTTRGIIEMEPLFWPARNTLSELFREEGKLADAERSLEQVLEQDPQNASLLRNLARVHLDAGNLQKARLTLGQLRPNDEQNFRVRMTRAQLYALEGKRVEALKEMDAEELKYADLNPLVTLEAAEVYAVLGDKDRAFDWLDRSVRRGDDRAEWLRIDPLLASIRQEPRFKEVLDSMDFRRAQAAAAPAKQ